MMISESRKFLLFPPRKDSFFLIFGISRRFEKYQRPIMVKAVNIDHMEYGNVSRLIANMTLNIM
jgi:hypothetical protein